MLLDALATKADLHVPVPDTGSYAQDLRTFLSSSFALGRSNPVIDTLRALMAQAQIDPEFGARFRAGFLQSRRDALGVLVDRAHDRRDLTPGVSPDTVADVVFGTVWYRLLATDKPLDEHLADELVGLLTSPAPIHHGK